MRLRGEKTERGEGGKNAEKKKKGKKRDEGERRETAKEFLKKKKIKFNPWGKFKIAQKSRAAPAAATGAGAERLRLRVFPSRPGRGEKIIPIFGVSCWFWGFPADFGVAGMFFAPLRFRSQLGAGVVPSLGNSSLLDSLEELGRAG